MAIISMTIIINLIIKKISKQLPWCYEIFNLLLEENNGLRRII